MVFQIFNNSTFIKQLPVQKQPLIEENPCYNAVDAKSLSEFRPSFEIAP